MTEAMNLTIQDRWPARNPDVIQLYSLATPNGQKVSVALEEMGLPYEAHTVNILEGDQHTPEFMSVNPNAKIPAIVDPNGPPGGPAGKPLPIMESGAILLYLADKSGKLMPADPIERSLCIQWVFFQIGSVGPMFGQFGHFFRFARETCKDPYPVERYTTETKRLLGVLEQRLDGRDYIVGGDYSIADIAIFPWVRTLNGFYEAGEQVGYDDYKRVVAWVDRCVARPATATGLEVCALPPRDD